MAFSKKCLILLVCMFGCALAQQQSEQISAADLVSDVYHNCLKYYKVSCVKSKALAWLTSVQGSNVIRITDELAIRKTGEVAEDQVSVKVKPAYRVPCYNIYTGL